MKKWLGIVAGALLSVIVAGGSAKVAQAACVTLGSDVVCSETVVDPVVCPDGCEGIVVLVGGDEGSIENWTVYTDESGDPIPVPGGYTDTQIAKYVEASAALNNVTDESEDNLGREGVGQAERTLGAVYGTYPNGKAKMAGFYLSPYGGYYPIDTSKKATRNWPGKGEPAPVLDCPDDSQPDFGAEADVNSTCMGGQLPTGNRVKYTGFCNPHEAWATTSF